VTPASSDGNDTAAPFTLGSRVSSFAIRRRTVGDGVNEVNNGSGRQVFNIGGSIIPKRNEDPNATLPDRREDLDTSVNSSTVNVGPGQGTPGQGSTPYVGRTIRFPDEPAIAVVPPTRAAGAGTPEHS